MLPRFPIAAVNLSNCTSTRTAATALRLSHESKLQKVLHELKVKSLPNPASHKQQLLSLVAKYLDVIAEKNSDVSTTNLTFNKINTNDVRLLRNQFVDYRTARCAVLSSKRSISWSALALHACLLRHGPRQS